MEDAYTSNYQLETHAEVEERISRSRATLCAMRDPDDYRYDPAFPEPVPVGPLSNPYASIRFEKKEVDKWIESRMAMRPNGIAGRVCTNPTCPWSTGTPENSG